MTLVNVVGYSAGAVTALTFLPQVIKTWKEKSAKDISLLMFLIAGLNEIMWIVYAIMLVPTNWVIITTNVIMLAMVSVMIYLKLTYNHK